MKTKTKNSRYIKLRPDLSGHNGSYGTSPNMQAELVPKHRAPGKKEIMGSTEEGP